MSNDWRDPGVKLRELDEDFARRFGRLVRVEPGELHPDDRRPRLLGGDDSTEPVGPPPAEDE